MSTKAVTMSTQVLAFGKAVALTPGVPTVPMAHVDKPEIIVRVDFKRCQ